MTSMNMNVNAGIADIANIGLCDIALERAIERTHSLPGMVCLYGPRTLAALNCQTGLRRRCRRS